MLVAPIVIGVIALVCAFWDWRTGRIPNAITVPTLASGLGYGLLYADPIGTILGVIVGGGVYGVLAWAGAMGGGDMKMGAALGAWGGFPFAVLMVVFASIFGGVQALLAVRHVATHTALVFLAGQGLRGARIAFKESFQPGQMVPYGISIGLGAIVAALWPYLPGAIGGIGRDVYALLATVVGR